MKKNLILFLTHNFNKIFINTLEKINNIYNNCDVIVLFDNSKTYDEKLVQHLITLMSPQNMKTTNCLLII